jgi:hypothetical protein
MLGVRVLPGSPDAPMPMEHKRANRRYSVQMTVNRFFWCVQKFSRAETAHTGHLSVVWVAAVWPAKADICRN